MKHHKKTILFITFFAVLLLLISLGDVLKKEETFSENENRLLAKAPEFSWSALVKGTFTKEYETYLNDQFFLRNECIFIKTYADIALQKKEIKGVYLGKQGVLLPKYLEEEFQEKTKNQKIELLSRLTEQYTEKLGKEHVRVMLVPTADNISTERLPSFAPYFDEKAFLDQVQERIGEDIFVDVYKVLKEHKEEKIYYGTDHHWTTLGAYYGFSAWGNSLGLQIPSLEEYQIQTVASDFFGTLHSKINIPVTPDTIEIFTKEGDSTDPINTIRVWYDFQEVYKTTLYEEKHLNTKNKYGFFLDDNHPFIKIQTQVKNGKTLFVIKDSYANCLIPFLTSFYENICIVDLRYYKIGLVDLMETQGTTDILVLYNVIQFIQDFQYY